MNLFNLNYYLNNLLFHRVGLVNAYLLTLFALLMYCASEYWIEPYHKAVALDNGDKA